MQHFLRLTILLWGLSSCSELTVGEYANQEFYFNLDTLNISSWKINNIELDNSIVRLSEIGPIRKAGSQNLLSRIEYGDSSIRSHKIWFNFFGQSDSVLFRVWTKSIYIGKENELNFSKRKDSLLVNYCSFISADYPIQTEFGILSKKTNIRTIIDKFPSSAKWLNDRVHEPSQYLLDLSEPAIESFQNGLLQWIPFSDGKRGTVHLLFLDQRLIFVKRNWDEI